MSEMFPETSPSPFGPDGPPAAMVEEARRAHALELAVRAHAARKASMLGDPVRDRAIIETAAQFADYLRGGGDG